MKIEIKKICNFCKKEYITKSYNSKYCCNKCRELDKTPSSGYYICKNCQKEFYYNHGQNNYGKPGRFIKSYDFCCYECGLEYINNKIHETWNKNWENGKPQSNKEVIKKSKLSKFNDSNYISKKERKKNISESICIECGKKYNCNPKLGNWFKGNIQKLGYGGVSIYKFCCYECGNKHRVKVREQTCLDKYGVRNTFQGEKSKNKIKEKYGVENPFYSKKLQEKCVKSKKEKYGNGNNYNKIKNTNLKKYGIENPGQIENHNKKCLETMKKNNSFRSEPEENIYQLLLQKFSQVKRQYKSEKYSFNCDFYIPSLDLYIEYQGTWLHGKEPYNENNEEHIKILEKWKLKNTNFYNTAIKIWTIKDPLKRQTAKDNNLNWIEFFNMNQFMEWYNSLLKEEN